MTAIDAAGFFRDVSARIGDAEGAADVVVERWLEIAGCTLRIRFIGSALVPYLLPALDHLEVQWRETADLTLHCWDCESLGVGFPMAPVPMSAFTARGEINGLNDGRFQAAFESGGRLLSLMDRRDRTAVYCVGAASRLPRFDIAEPIRIILSWFLRDHGRQLLHAAAVGTAEGGVLLIGPSGAGKSNTALGSLASDLLYAADDFCAVSVAGVPTVYSVYSTGKTEPGDWGRYPFLSGLAANLDPDGRDKVIYFLNQARPDKLIGSFPLRAILVLQQGGERCELRPIPPAAVLGVAAPYTTLLLADSGREVFRCLARLARSVPCYTLRLGSVPSQVPNTILELLREREAAERAR